MEGAAPLRGLHLPLEVGQRGGAAVQAVGAVGARVSDADDDDGCGGRLWEAAAGGVVDEHAHNLLPLHLQEASFRQAFTEATDQEQVEQHAHQTFFFRRSLRDLAIFFGCAPTEEAIREARSSISLEELSSKCFKAANICALLLDDGFKPDQIMPMEWHKQFVPHVRSILRLEYEAECILVKEDIKNVAEFDAVFRRTIDENLPDQVVGFKSIAAYRSGLRITNPEPQDLEEAFTSYKQAVKVGQPAPRLCQRALVNHVVLAGLEVAARRSLPVQFHTGFGDPDLDLAKSNPLLLRTVLEDRSLRGVRIVLLHSSYPFTREAGYLASVYPQVYLDFGLAIPNLSINGMTETLKMLFELAPTSKILYSSDAHLIPELYYLGAHWGRRVLVRVLAEAVNAGEITREEAPSIARDVLYSNACRLYQLNLSEPPPQAGITCVPSRLSTQTTRQRARQLKEDLESKGVSFLRMVWTDNAGLRRAKLIPLSRLESVAETGSGLTSLAQGFAAHPDGPVEGTGLSVVGEVFLVPDLASVRGPLPYFPSHAIALADIHSVKDTPWGHCPRSFLKTQVARAKDLGFDIMCGFENEFFLLRSVASDGRGHIFEPLDRSSYSATFALANPPAAAVIDEITTSLRSQNVHLWLLHAEYGPSQFEMALMPNDPVAAADNQVVFKETATAIALKHGLTACFLPKLWANEAGSGCHLHISLWKDGVNLFTLRPEPAAQAAPSQASLVPAVHMFIAGILHHLPAAMAVICPTPNSYRRLHEHSWAGVYQCWGVDNKDAPLRLPSSSSERAFTNVEIKTLDATANPYLALGVIIAAGLDGIIEQRELPRQMDRSPESLSELGISRLPSNLFKAITLFQEDKELLAQFGIERAKAYLAVKKAEMKGLEKLSLPEEFQLLATKY